MPIHNFILPGGLREEKHASKGPPQADGAGTWGNTEGESCLSGWLPPFCQYIAGWWFGTSFMTFHSVGNNHPNWRIHIFRRGRYTTNQIECASRFSFLQEVFEQLGLGFSAIVWCALICRQGLLPLMQIGVRVFRCWVCSDTCRHQCDMRGDVLDTGHCREPSPDKTCVTYI